MKTKIKRHSRAVLSVALAVCMLVSCMAVGLIATSAAYTDGKLPSNNTADFAKDKGDASLGAKDSEDVELGAKDDSDSLGGNTSASYMFHRQGGDLNSESSPVSSFTKTTGSSVTFTTTSSDWYLVAASDSSTLYNTYVYDSTPYVKVGSTRRQSQITSGSCWIEPYKDGSKNAGVKLSAPAGTQVTVQFTNTSGNENTYIATFTSNSYTISYNTPPNGSFTTKPTTGTESSTIEVVATPNDGYELSNVSVYKTDASSTAVSYSRSGNTITFTMPAYAVTVDVTFSVKSYNITKAATGCTITASSTAEYGSTVNFTIAPDTNYALRSLTVKQNNTNITTTKIDDTHYSFTMPAGNVTITATCATTSGSVDVYFKSATAWVYHPIISVNGGAEQEMTTIARELTNGSKSSLVKPKSDTGSLRYVWYKISLTGVDTSKPVNIHIRANDTYMEAEGTFNLSSGSEVYLACDNLMEGSTLVDVSALPDEQKDFYDTPLNMIDD